MELFIYEPIGTLEGEFTGIDALTIAGLLAGVPASEPLVIRFNTAGGLITEANAIYSLLLSKPNRKIGIVDGACYSAGMLPLMACDEIRFADGASAMIHDVRQSGMEYEPNEEGYLKTARELCDFSNKLAAILDRRMKLGVDGVRALMRATTYFTANEALAAGLCDSVLSGQPAMTNFAMTRFFKLALPEKITMSRTPPTASATGSTAPATAAPVTAPTNADTAAAEPGVTAEQFAELAARVDALTAQLAELAATMKAASAPTNTPANAPTNATATAQTGIVSADQLNSFATALARIEAKVNHATSSSDAPVGGGSADGSQKSKPKPGQTPSIFKLASKNGASKN